MLVTRIIGDCPGCGAARSYGNVSVIGQELVRGCQRCDIRTNVYLPPIRKKIIYLDQFFFSHAFRGRDDRFVTAADRIKQLTHAQLLVSPYSSVHEDETHQWRGYGDKTGDDLMEFIKATSRGVMFEPAYRIERAQVIKAFAAFLSDASPQVRLESGNAIRGNLQQWDSYFRIDVRTYIRDSKLKRRLKTEAVRDLVTLFDQWTRSAETFEQHVAIEMRDAGRLYVHAYLEMAGRVARGDFTAIIDSPIAATLVEGMLDLLPAGIQGPDRLQRCVDFFNSNYFGQVPNERISASLFATLREMVKRGAYSDRDEARKRLSGIFDDIAHVSIFAPYCDAFVMDTPMAELVRQPTVALERQYPVKVFSLRNWDELFIWLDELEARMTDEHRAALKAVYP
jgi:hypothetical protein